MRYDLIREWEGFLKDAMVKQEKFGPIDEFGDNRIIIHDGKEYSTYVDGYHLMAKKVWEDMQAYEEVKTGHLHRFSSGIHSQASGLS
jgi:hypothetical protein